MKITMNTNFLKRGKSPKKTTDFRAVVVFPIMNT